MTILVVDDESRIVDAVRSYLEAAGYGVLCAGSGEAALRLFDEHHPDLVVLDLMLGDLSGQEVCRRIRRTSRVPILMLTARVDEASILEGLSNGADDYVTKPFSPRQLVARIQAILRRAGPEGPQADRLRYDDGLEIDFVSHRVFRNGDPVHLTRSELQLLETLARHPGRAFTRDELVRLALGEDFDGFDRAVDSHIKNLRLKVEVDAHHPRRILTAFGIGYRFHGD